MFGDHLALVLINLLGLVGIAVWYFQGRGRPMARLIVQILFFAGMTAVLGFSDILPHWMGEADLQGSGAYLAKSARVLWWTHLAWTLVGFVRLYIVLEHRPQEARLLQDLVVAAIYLGVALSITGFVFGAPIGTLAATSGVVAIIVGLALQNTLGDVFSGIALTLGRPFTLGDWIMLSDGTEGRVVETTWRSTHLLTGANNIVVLPNSVLAKLSLTNLSRPDERQQLTLAVRLAATHAPHVIEEAMHAALRNCQRIVKEPAPLVALKEIDAAAIGMDLLFCVAGPGDRLLARNEVIDLVHRHCEANGLSLAMSPQSYAIMLPATAGQPLARIMR
ncbi:MULTISPECIES: mechanosensitive ion channel family protein [unclassified Mesorhizobium]|uniref:mechanosensitive ion channel family protein n=1 Tax=unclassified Mesorhizobium TaxID=325217 RepID=UPI000FD2BD7D|nr:MULTISPECIES: mechanosensitive ion channel family protein [unclassified Mesorhizobium]RUX07055.1 mechanosensitive ion channel family protein [Mesorhizobium sp. M8A.F.Ca.ET.059.01.1.1]TGR47262.1 mechanosensitive ion channel family protein [bacterium M00.F.Ca.ET.199.01.1.1]TGU36716.1 mechanosensitive ion channel family protein [bacterium M00.F.Ca.ET.156.01.1.1]TGV87903.1 mechanosensitive ion channel family protein [Mesorhizobium sp. M00.F.Ca.ET.149.01.1.1]RWC82955.1 MAG: mechanosensitive ion 